MEEGVMKDALAARLDCMVSTRLRCVSMREAVDMRRLERWGEERKGAVLSSGRSLGWMYQDEGSSNSSLSVNNLTPRLVLVYFSPTDLISLATLPDLDP